MEITNKKKLLQITFCFIFIFGMFFSFHSQAAPVIDGVSGKITNDESVTISGSAFGIKTDPAPIRFEKWNGAIEGQNPAEASENWWSVVGRIRERPLITYVNSRIPGQATVDMSMHPHVENSTSSNSLTFFKDGIDFAFGGKVYLNFWFYTDFGNSPLNENINTQMKFVRVANKAFNNTIWDSEGTTGYFWPLRNISLWEHSEPNNNTGMITTYSTGSQTLGAKVVRNDEGSALNIIKQEGWHNYQWEIDMGTIDQPNGREIVRMTDPAYSKYGVSDSGEKVVLGTSPTWISGMNVSSSATIYHNGKRYANVRGGDFVSTIPPDQDTYNWMEAPNNDYFNSLIFWIWSQKRGDNEWVAGNQYYAGAKVDYNNKAYQCSADILSDTPPDADTSHWNLIHDFPWPSSTTKVYIDSIYVDNSFARIEIGNDSVYNSSSHREIQAATEWDDNHIQFNVSKGTFSDGETAYIFVVDENGNASNGYPITFATEMDLVSPILSNALNIATTKNTTPSFVFTSDESGTINYSGSCSSATSSAITGENTITFNELSRGATYSDCTITVTDSEGNISDPLQIPEFTITYPSDNDLDKDVDIFDYNILLGNFGAQSDCQNPADTNEDCEINIFDYNILLADFGNSL